MGKKNELIETYKFRYACKEFDPDKKIPPEDFELILETGRLSPSSFGWEPWKFVIIQDMDVREKLKEFSWGAQKQLPTASHFVLIMARKAVDTRAEADYIKHIAKDVKNLSPELVDMKLDKYNEFQHNDFDLTDNRKLFDWASKQSYIPLANMMTAAAHIGIDSCPMEGFDREKLENFLSEKGIIDIRHFGLSVMVAFGYRAKGTHVREKTRQPLSDVVEWIR